MADRDYDIVLFGATGFTGGLTAEYLARNAPDTLHWALAGRSIAKLESVRERLAKIDPRFAELPLIEANVNDGGSIDAVAQSTRVVITTVGPYALYGAPLVGACANAGTDYVDLAGEPEFVDKMWLLFNERAKETGARLVHCCGFDSIPHDLGAYFTVLQLPEGVPLKVDGQVLIGGQFSGGTFASALNGFARGRQTIAAARERIKREQKPAGRKARLAVKSLRKDPARGKWLAPLPTIDGFVVRRSAEAVDRYGPNFTYSHNMESKHLITPLFMGGLISVAMIAAQIRPIRHAIQKAVPAGTGPSEELRAKSWFRVRFTGEGGGEKVVTEFSGGDPGYSETSKMLAESGMALALDDIPDRSGQLSPVAAMGDALLVRLQNAGMTIRVVE
jgi:short subunit dehydrogenase-like uncharacterized protein